MLPSFLSSEGSTAGGDEGSADGVVPADLGSDGSSGDEADEACEALLLLSSVEDVEVESLDDERDERENEHVCGRSAHVEDRGGRDTRQDERDKQSSQREAARLRTDMEREGMDGMTADCVSRRVLAVD